MLTITRATDEHTAINIVAEIEAWFIEDFKCSITSPLLIPTVEELEYYIANYDVYLARDNNGAIFGCIVAKAERCVWMFSTPERFLTLAEDFGEHLKRTHNTIPWGAVEREEMRAVYLSSPKFRLADIEPYGNIVIQYVG